MNKRVITLLMLTMCLLFSNSKAVIQGDFDIENGKIVSYLGSASEVTIPNNVSEIGDFAFINAYTVEKIIIPGNVTKIGEAAFTLSAVKTVIIEEGCLEIGEAAFSATDIQVLKLPASINKQIPSNILEDVITNVCIEAPYYIELANGQIEETFAKAFITQYISTATNNPSKVQKNFKIQINKIGNGQCSVSKKISEGNEEIELTVQEAIGHSVKKLEIIDIDGNTIPLADNKFTMPQKDVEINVEFKINEYTINATTTGNGTITPNGETIKEYGQSQKYTIAPDSGNMLVDVLIDGKSVGAKSSYTFQNISENHTIEAIFEEIKYNELTLKLSDVIETILTHKGGTNLTVKGSGSKFLGWVVNGVTLKSDNTYTFNMPNNNMMIVYKFDEQNIVMATPSVSNGKSTVTVSQSEVITSLTNSKANSLEILVPKVSNEKESEVTITSSTISELNDSVIVEDLKISTPVASLTMDKSTINTLNDESTGNVTFTLKKCDESDLTEEQIAQAGNNAVYKFEIESNGNLISNFDGTISVTVNYVPRETENINTIKVYYLAGNGELTEVNAVYSNCSLTFETNHFSEYLIENGRDYLPGEEIFEEESTEDSWEDDDFIDDDFIDDDFTDDDFIDDDFIDDDFIDDGKEPDKDDSNKDDSDKPSSSNKGNSGNRKNNKEEKLSEQEKMLNELNYDKKVEVLSLMNKRPAYYISESNKEMLSSNNNVFIEYQLQSQENPNAIVVYYVSESGEIEIIPTKYRENKVSFNYVGAGIYIIGHNKKEYTDVKENVWYSDAINFVSAREIATGVGNNLFAPNANITRGQFIKMICDAYQIKPIDNYENNFSDAGETWYTPYLAAAKDNQIVAGYEGNLFKPNQEITRQEICVILHKVMGSPQTDTNKTTQYDDCEDISSWAKEAVEYLLNQGIISGYENKIHPKQTATRAEMSQIIYNLLND